MFDSEVSELSMTIDVSSDRLVSHSLIESVIDSILLGYLSIDEAIYTLVESRIDFIKAKWNKSGVSSSHDHLATHRDPSNIVDHFATHADPTLNKEYTDKVMNWYHSGGIRQEDTGRIHQALSTFHSKKHRLDQRSRDIGSYKTFHDLEGAVDRDFPQSKSEVKAGDQSVIDKGSTVLHKDDKLHIKEIHDHDAMKVLGRNTKWCTASDQGKGVFKDYQKDGPLYWIHDKAKNSKYLLHFGSGQLMDEKDSPVSPDALAKSHPKLVDLFHGKHYNMFTDKDRADKEILAGKHDLS